jgi:tripartite-type tricarboxylate transporter receptor subunit TctC
MSAAPFVRSNGEIMTRVITILAALFSAAVSASAQSWPTRPITMVIPLAAGGGSDGLIPNP